MYPGFSLEFDGVTLPQVVLDDRNRPFCFCCVHIMLQLPAVFTVGIYSRLLNIKIATVSLPQMLLHYHLPTKLQRWIIGKRLPADTDTLESLGVTSNSSESPVYLYMMSAKFAGINREQVEREIRKASGLYYASFQNSSGRVNAFLCSVVSL
jgi:hypothetical protein